MLGAMQPSTSFYEHPDLYDLEYATHVEDLGFYTGLARSAGRVLELGCGTGRLSLPMARAGAEVVGVDRAEPMLERLRARAAAEPRLRLRAEPGDMTKLALNEQFDAIFLPFNAIHHVHEAEALIEMLGRIRAHLRPGGLFALDMIVPQPKFWERQPDGVYEVRWFPDPEGGRMKSWENGWYNPITQVNTVRYHYQRASGLYHFIEIPMRMYYPQEALALLGAGGFRVERMSGDFEGRPANGISGKLVLELRAR